MFQGLYQNWYVGSELLFTILGSNRWKTGMDEIEYHNKYDVIAQLCAHFIFIIIENKFSIQMMGFTTG